MKHNAVQVRNREEEEEEGVDDGWVREGAGGREGSMHSSVNEIHHHPSDSFVTFSTGAVGRPPGSYTSKTRMSASWWLGGTLFSSNEMFFVFLVMEQKEELERKKKHFGMFLHVRSLIHAHTHSHIHRQLPRRSKTGTVSWSLKLHQTNKQWKLKTPLFTQWFLFFLKK